MRYSTKLTADELIYKCNFTPRQLQVFEMRYVIGNNIDFIADILGYSNATIKVELKTIRAKIEKVTS